MPLELKFVETQQVIFSMIRETSGFIRAGSTEDPRHRRSAYEGDGYGGTMYCAKTDNMKKAENQLLASRNFLHNDHSRSNATEGRGYIYVIKGRRY